MDGGQRDLVEERRMPLRLLLQLPTQDLWTHLGVWVHWDVDDDQTYDAEQRCTY